MSWITTCVLCADGGGVDIAVLERINEWIAAHVASSAAAHYRIACLNDAFVGRSAAQVDFYGMALRYIELDDFIAFLRELPWEKSSPVSTGDVVQLIVNDEHDTGVRLVAIHGEAKLADPG